MPAGTPLEQTRGAARAGRLSGDRARSHRLPGLRRHRAPINFNGLVRQYYLRSAAELGDIQVNLLDKHQRERKSHEIASAACEPALEKIAKAWGAKVKVVEVPPGPPVLSPIVAEVYGPDYAGQMRGGEARCASSSPPRRTSSASTTGRREAAPKLLLQVLQSKAALLGVAPRDIVDTMRIGAVAART